MSEPKAEEWKKKFLEVSESLEKQEEYQQLLERSLNRLALACQGIDKNLDKTLAKLRKVLRAKTHDAHQISDVLRELERSIGQMDEKSTDTPHLADNLHILLSRITWPKQHAKTASSLIEKTQKVDAEKLPAVVDQIVALIEQSFVAEQAQSDSGLFGRLFGTKAQKKARSASEIEAAQTSSEKQSSYTIAPHTLLIGLLEQLSLPKDINQKATQIRHNIQNGISQDQLPSVINDVAGLVGEITASASNDKKEYEAFLIALMQKITALDQYLNQFEQDEMNAYEQRRSFGQSVEQEMVGLKLDVDDARELDQLRQTLNTRIDKLNQHISNAHRADVERFEQAQEQINNLNQQLQVMESEAQSLREATKKARELAAKDPLTGLWNRQALNEVLEREYARWQRYQKPLCMVIWDIDHFKRINDEFGHSAGDVTLKTIAQVLTKRFRKSDFVARYGGEEFLVLLPETELDNALTIANKVRKVIENTHFFYKDSTVPITASAGLAMFEVDDTIEKVFNRADHALYQAKASGRNNCVVERI